MRWSKSNSTRSGIALILVLFFVAVISIVIVSFTFSSNVNVRIARNYRDDLKVRYGLESGLIYARKLLLKDPRTHDSLNDIWNTPHPSETGLEPTDNKHTLSLGESDIPVEIEIEITDESSKINVNELLTNNDTVNTQRKEELANLITLLGGKPETISRLIDWLDKNTIGTYETGAKNKKLDTLNQIGLIKDIDKELLYGKSQKGTEEFSLVRTDDGFENKKGLIDFLTIHSGNKVNVNTVSLEVLTAILDDSKSAKSIIDARSKKPFEDLADLKSVAGLTNTLYKKITPRLTVKSSIFSARITARAGRIKKKVTGVLKRNKRSVDIIFLTE